MQKSWCPSRAVRSCTKTYFNVISKDLSKDKGTFQSIIVACFMVFIQVDPRRANGWVYFTQTKWLLTLDIPCKDYMRKMARSVDL